MRSIEEEILVNGLSDYVGLWEIVRLEKRTRPTSLDWELKDEVLKTIRSLFRDGMVDFGEVNVDGTFSKWPLGGDEAVELID
ncbi:MAG: hypothetical protein ABI298_01770, partial [Acidimicrobiales bacterium]